MRKFSILSLCFIYITLLTSTVSAAIFASDVFYFFVGDEPISDNSVLVNATDWLETTPLDVCKDGKLYIRQGYTSPFYLIVMQTSHENIMTYKTWSRSEEGHESKSRRRDYQNYLHLMAADTVLYRTIAVPTCKEEPSLEETPRMPIKDGMTGGLVGSFRYFRVDLDKDDPIIQIKRSDAPLGDFITTETSEDGTTCVKGVSAR